MNRTHRPVMAAFNAAGSASGPAVGGGPPGTPRTSGTSGASGLVGASSVPSPSGLGGGALSAWWQELQGRQRRIVLLGAVVVGAALVWWVALAPALTTLRRAPAQHALLDAQLQNMQTLAAQARALQSAPKLPFEDALASLETSLQQKLGAAGRVVVSGERVTVTLKAAPADALAQWLTQVRVNARATVTDVRLARSGAGVVDAASSTALTSIAALAGTAGGSAASGGAGRAAPFGARWDGTVVLALPPR